MTAPQISAKQTPVPSSQTTAGASASKDPQAERALTVYSPLRPARSLESLRQGARGEEPWVPASASLELRAGTYEPISGLKLTVPGETQLTAGAQTRLAGTRQQASATTEAAVLGCLLMSANMLLYAPELSLSAGAVLSMVLLTSVWAAKAGLVSAPTSKPTVMWNSSQPLEVSAYGVGVRANNLWVDKDGVVGMDAAMRLGPLPYSQLLGAMAATVVQRPELWSLLGRRDVPQQLRLAATSLDPAQLLGQAASFVEADAANDVTSTMPAQKLVHLVDATLQAGQAKSKDGDATDKAARAAFNALLDRSHVQGTIQLHPGEHVISQLGVSHGLRLRVPPNTTVRFSTGRIDQNRPPLPDPWHVRLGAALGLILAVVYRLARRLLALVGLAKAQPVASPAPAPAPTATSPEAALLAHKFEARLTRPVRVGLNNASRHVLALRIHGLDIDPWGRPTPRASLELFGLPVLSLGHAWVRNLLAKQGLLLTTDAYRLLWQGDIFAPNAALPPPAPVSAEQAGQQAAWAARLQGALLGAIQLKVTPTEQSAPRYVTQVKDAAGKPITLSLFRTQKAFMVEYDLHRFQRPLTIGLHNLELEAQLAGEGEADAERAKLFLGGLEMRRYRPSIHEAPILQALHLQGLRAGVVGDSTALHGISVSKASLARDTSQSLMDLHLELLPGQETRLAKLAGLASPWLPEGLSMADLIQLPRRLTVIRQPVNISPLKAPFAPGAPAFEPAFGAKVEPEKAAQSA